MTVFLVGMPGSGKSTVGLAVAQQLGWAFDDLDGLMIDSQGLPIVRLFELLGEPGFRELESQTLHHWASSPENPAAGRILATGGGAPCYLGNMALMNQLGTTVWLNPPLAALAQRLAAVTDRPLLRLAPNQTLLQRLEALYAERWQHYAQARYQIRADALAQVVAEVARKLQPE